MTFQANPPRPLNGNESCDEFWMRCAIDLAIKARDNDEVPVGAVLVLNNEMIGEGYNLSISAHDPTAHAEIQALRTGAKQLQNYRLIDSSLYVTLEPCMMCVGALVHARIKRLIYGAYDNKTGAVSTQSQLLNVNFINHYIEHQGGILQDQCAALLSDFFASKRG